MRPVCASYLLSTVEVAAGWNLITVSMGPGGDPILLTLNQTPDYRSGAFPKLRAERPNQFRIHYLSGGEIYSVTLHETDENYCHVQPIGLDQWLLVRGRAESAADLNAHIYDADGQLLRSFHAGDGIQTVQTTTDDQVWVSYFDEGVLSGVKLGHAGVACFDPDGRLTFEYDRVAAQNGLPFLLDCYAMNVASKEDVWIYYYTDFPLVRLRRKQFDRQWTNVPVRGSHAFAVTESQALFAGSYEKEDRLFLVSLGTMQVEELQPVDEMDEPVQFLSAFGRGTRLYLESDEALYAVDVCDV